MCVWEFCCKCLSNNDEAVPASIELEEPERAGSTSTSSEPHFIQSTTLYDKVVSPLTPPRSNRSKVHTAIKLNEDLGRQISSISDETPEVLKRQSAAFRTIQTEDVGKAGNRKRNQSSPGKLESSSAESLEVQIIQKHTSETEYCPRREERLHETVKQRIKNEAVRKLKYSLEGESQQLLSGSKEAVQSPSQQTKQQTATEELQTKKQTEAKEDTPQKEDIPQKEDTPQKEDIPQKEDTPQKEVQEPEEEKSAEQPTNIFSADFIKSLTDLIEFARSSSPEQLKSTEVPKLTQVPKPPEDYDPSEEFISDSTPSETETEEEEVAKQKEEEEEMPFKKMRTAFSKKTSNKRNDPKKKVRNVHKPEQDKAAVGQDLSKSKNRRKKNTTKGKQSTGQSRSSKIATLAAAGLLVSTSDIPYWLTYDQYLDQQIVLHYKMFQLSDAAPSENIAQSSHQTQVPADPLLQSLYNTQTLSMDSLAVQPNSGGGSSDRMASIQLSTGQTVSNVDRRGTIRGPCTLCKDCEQYEVENGLSCDYCGCPPGKHKNIGHFNQQSLAKPLQVDQQTALPSEPSSFGRAPVYPQQTPQQNTKSTRKPLSVSDVSDLPGSMTLENAINYLSLERAQSTEFGKPAHFSSPELNLSDRQSTNQSYRSDMISNRSDVASSNDLGAIYQAMSRRNTNAYDRSRSDVDIPKLGEWEDENTFEIAEDMSGSGPQNYTSPTATLTLRQDSTDETCRIVPLNGGDVVRGVLKEPIQLKVDITPITIKKHHVLWFHNNKKISPRYRVRFVNERREIHILSLRKKDAGVYKCQIKHSSGKEKKTTACTMILDVQVPHFVAKDL